MKNYCNTERNRNCHDSRGRGCCQSERLGFRRSYISKAEKIERLEEYKAELEKEIIAVEENLKDLSS